MIRPPPADQPWDFRPLYRDIKALVEPADIAFINQETLLGGGEFGFSGYPRFNSPQELGLAIADTGFDVVNHATNHIMDKGEGAVLATMDFWDTLPELRYLGIFRSREDREAKRVIIEKNGIRVGFLAYTYGTNGLPVPRDKPYLVSLIDREIMRAEIGALRPLCDYLVVSMHWGNEYEHTPSNSQTELARFLAEQGVDLVIGHHPHVLQPLAVFPRAGGAPMVCAYSLGNFISAQRPPPTLLGGLLYVRLKKEGGLISVDQAGLIPVVTHYEGGFTNFRVIPLDAYTPELAARHGGTGINVPFFTSLAESVLKEGLLRGNPFGDPQGNAD
jgi:poly-gamma-glutamate synthesis protein (capsule biosynthesis protein)